jgi:WD40 repeat protein
LVSSTKTFEKRKRKIQYLAMVYFCIGQIWSASNYSMVGSLPTMLDVRAMAISSELIYLGCKGGTVEIWGREKNNRVEILQTGSNGKVNCMVLDGNEEVLVIGTSDGQIQVKQSLSRQVTLAFFYVCCSFNIGCFFKLIVKASVFVCRHGD